MGVYHKKGEKKGSGKFSKPSLFEKKKKRCLLCLDSPNPSFASKLQWMDLMGVTTDVLWNLEWAESMPKGQLIFWLLLPVQTAADYLLLDQKPDSAHCFAKGVSDSCLTYANQILSFTAIAKKPPKRDFQKPCTCILRKLKTCILRSPELVMVTTKLLSTNT